MTDFEKGVLVCLGMSGRGKVELEYVSCELLHSVSPPLIFFFQKKEKRGENILSCLSSWVQRFLSLLSFTSSEPLEAVIKKIWKHRITQI